MKKKHSALSVLYIFLKRCGLRQTDIMPGEIILHQSGITFIRDSKGRHRIPGNESEFILACHLYPTVPGDQALSDQHPALHIVTYILMICLQINNSHTVIPLSQ